MRHAIYYTPSPASDLHHLGSAWLGRDALTCEAVPQPDRRLASLVAAPRRYGLHATLKPPFRLKDRVQVASFDSAISRLAFQHERFLAPALKLKILSGFLALVPSAVCKPLDNLAAGCVQHLDDFRSPPGEAELHLRRAAVLTPRQERLLLRWGYPYVLEEFRFHITLTGRLSNEEASFVRPLAEQHFAPVLGKELMIDAITLMLEPAEGEDFRALERFPLVQTSAKVA
jgi:putative phosphonate metabolism protein